MSDATSTPVKANAWTEEAKNEFLLRIIMQLKPDGKGINWSEIQMPNRTVKSLQNQWTIINKRIDQLRQQQQEGGAPPAKKPTPRKRKAKKTEDDEDDDASFVTPKKARGRKRTTVEDTPEVDAKDIKAEAAELADIPIKGESEADADSAHGQV